MNQTFSKILIGVIVVLIAGGFVIYGKFFKELSLEKSFEIKAGETLSIPSEGIRITFTDVLEDSRCPKNVECFWAGQAKIKVHVLKEAHDFGDFELILGTDKSLATQIFDNYSIKLLRLNPYPTSPDKIHIEFSQYIATLIISKTNARQAEATNWQTYSNEEFGFTFKYPEDIFIKVERPMNMIIHSSARRMIGSVDVFDVAVYVGSIRISPLVDAQEWLGDPPSVKPGELQIADTKVYVARSKQSKDEKEVIRGYYFPTFVLQFAFANNEAEYKWIGIEQQILSTLQFLDKEPTENIEKISWKTYRNEKYGFEVKYPDVFAFANDRGYCHLWEKTDYGGLLSIGIATDIVISVADSGDLSLSQYVDNYVDDKILKFEKDVQKEMKSQTNTFVSGEEAIKIVYSFEDASTSFLVEANNYTVIFVKKSNNIFKFEYDPEGTHIGRSGVNCSLPNGLFGQKLADQILSTFRFLE